MPILIEFGVSNNCYGGGGTLIHDSRLAQLAVTEMWMEGCLDDKKG